MTHPFLDLVDGNACTGKGAAERVSQDMRGEPQQVGRGLDPVEHLSGVISIPNVFPELFVGLDQIAAVLAVRFENGGKVVAQRDCPGVLILERERVATLQGDKFGIKIEPLPLRIVNLSFPHPGEYTKGKEHMCVTAILAGNLHDLRDLLRVQELRNAVRDAVSFNTYKRIVTVVEAQFLGVVDYRLESLQRVVHRLPAYTAFQACLFELLYLLACDFGQMSDSGGLRELSPEHILERYGGRSLVIIRPLEVLLPEGAYVRILTLFRYSDNTCVESPVDFALHGLSTFPARSSQAPIPWQSILVIFYVPRLAVFSFVQMRHLDHLSLQTVTKRKRTLAALW